LEIPIADVMSIAETLATTSKKIDNSTRGNWYILGGQKSRDARHDETPDQEGCQK
jgi:hypothetical protein